mmetsp:Transcript_18395/g.35849  ORF Transcript_18395/g.35849 Transcript_18395/m.35849 type:complete len:284 (+) Transcript_18395:294-1145(+)
MGGLWSAPSAKKILASVSESEREGIEEVTIANEAQAGVTLFRAISGEGADPEGTIDWVTHPVKDGVSPLFAPIPVKPDGTCDQPPDRASMIRWLVKNAMFEYHINGKMFGIKREDGNGYAAVMLCRPPNCTTDFLSELRAAWYAGITPPWEGKEPKLKHVKARVELALEILGKCHKECVKGPHWYVYMLMVDPQCKGKGYAKRLLSFIAALSARDLVPSYLEATGERNEAIYNKRGYQTIKKYPIGEGKAEQIGGDPLTVNGGLAGMVRQPTPRTVTTVSSGK